MEVKEDSREKLRVSKDKLEECDDEIRGQFQQMEEVGRRGYVVDGRLWLANAFG